MYVDGNVTATCMDTTLKTVVSVPVPYTYIFCVPQRTAHPTLCPPGVDRDPRLAFSCHTRASAIAQVSLSVSLRVRFRSVSPGARSFRATPRTSRRAGAVRGESERESEGWDGHRAGV